MSQPQTQSRKLPSWVTGFGAQVIAGLIIGLILGFIASKMDAGLTADDEKGSWLTQTLTGVGSAYVQLLKVMVPPLIFAAVVTSVANLRKVANAGERQTQGGQWLVRERIASVWSPKPKSIPRKPAPTPTAVLEESQERMLAAPPWPVIQPCPSASSRLHPASDWAGSRAKAVPQAFALGFPLVPPWAWAPAS